MVESVPESSTRLLRTSDEPVFRRLRVLLGELNLDPMAVVLADLFPDDVDQEFGVLVTEDRRVIEFVLYYGRQGDLNEQAASATIGELKDITARWDASPHASNIRAALELSAGT